MTAAENSRTGISASRGPLAGVRVVELCWVWAGPLCGQLLGDLGAQVIKVEWYKKFDIYRTRGVERLKGTVPERSRREMSHSFHSLNRNKLGVALDFKNAEHRKALLEIIATADLVIENFSHGTLERNGLGYRQMAEVNEKIVLLSLSGFGEASRLASMRAYGLVLSGLSGVEEAIRDPDTQEFVGSPTFVISDPNAAVYGILAAVNALYDARMTGSGLHVTVSQLEAAGHLLVESDGKLAALAEELGLEFEPAPSSVEVLRTADDHYIAVASRDSSEAASGLQNALAEMSRVEASQFLRDQGYSAVPVVSETTPTGVGATRPDTLIPSEHPETGYEELVAAPWWIDGARPALRKPAPILGESNRYVLGTIAQMSTGFIDGISEADAHEEASSRSTRTSDG